MLCDEWLNCVMGNNNIIVLNFVMILDIVDFIYQCFVMVGFINDNVNVFIGDVFFNDIFSMVDLIGWIDD